jgi:hypothetical protein
VDISGTTAIAIGISAAIAISFVVVATRERPHYAELPEASLAPRTEVKAEARSRRPNRERRRREPAAAPKAQAAPPRGVLSPSAEALVTAYYRALDERRFSTAWKALSPSVQERFGGFEGWRAGFATTVSSRPSDISVSADGTSVEHVLTAVDRSPCGEIRQRFAVTWKLLRLDGTWLAERLSAVKRSGPDPAGECA